MRAEYREEPCRNALNRVRGMPFPWSLNPYMGCAHRCTFCYVRAFEARADRPWDDRYGSSIRVKTNVADVLRRELARASWERETVALGAATDPYQPAEGRYRLTRACIEVLRRGGEPVRDHHARAADRPRRRRARRGGPPRRGLRHLLRPDARRRDLEAHRAGHGSTAPAAPGAFAARRGGDQRASRDGADPARPQRQVRSCSPTSCARPAPPELPGSGQTCSTCGPERASTSSPRSNATGPSCSPVRAPLPPRRLSPAPRRRPRARTRARARPLARRPRPPPRATRARSPGRTAANLNYVTADCRSMICRLWRPTRSPA